MAAQGEPHIFGIPKGEAEDFVNQRGLEVLSDLGTDELTKRYLVRSDGSVDGTAAGAARAAGFVRIMHASVPAPASSRGKEEGQSSGSSETGQLPKDVQVFLRQYAEDVLSGRIERIMRNYSAEFLQDGRDKKETEILCLRDVLD